MPDDASPSVPTPPEAPPPLSRLALSLSGGGYRAAAFHLGTLRLLERVGLLPNVVGLSTVSGGTLTGMAWVMSLIDKKPFSEFHAHFSSFLRQTNVIGDALEDLTSQRDPGSREWVSLIRSAANVYNRPSLFNDRRFGEVLGADGLQLEEVIFNSTEFHTGLDFRFRRSRDEWGLLGNHHYRLPRPVAQHLRLADIAAASSCFPSGFEPLVFPQHFHWSQDYPLEAALNELGPEFAQGLPLMDGGIYDNQGVSSLRTVFEDTSTTLLISDVGARQSELYNTPPDPTRRGWFTLAWVERLGVVMFWLALLSAGVLGVHAWRSSLAAFPWGLLDTTLYLFSGLLSASVAVALVWVRRRLREANTLLEQQTEVQAWPAFRELTVPEFVQLVVLRVTSLVALTSSIFMKRIRGLVFDSVFRDAKYKGLRLSNLIYSLARERPTLFTAHPWLKPRPDLVARAQVAERMPTTLWFTRPEEQFETLELTGEASVCFVLLRHIVEEHKGQYETAGLPLYDLFQRLKGEWVRLNGPSAEPRSEPTPLPLAG